MYELSSMIGHNPYMYVGVAGALLLVGCAGRPEVVEGPVPTVAEVVIGEVPTLAPEPMPPTSAEAVPSTGAAATVAPTASDVAPTPAAEPAPTPTDVAALAAVLAEDPDLAGARGRELLAELERVAAKPDDRRRVERARDRTAGWREDGQLEPAVAAAALALLEQALADLDGDGGDPDRDEDDGDD